MMSSIVNPLRPQAINQVQYFFIVNGTKNLRNPDLFSALHRAKNKERMLITARIIKLQRFFWGNKYRMSDVHSGQIPVMA